jgi:hypothetical protein
VGKLDALRIECDKCGRSGRYRVDRLIARYGIDAKLFDWSDEVTADCPRKIAKILSDMWGSMPRLIESGVRIAGIKVATRRAQVGQIGKMKNLWVN